jgi:hypothetical protein
MALVRASEGFFLASEPLISDEIRGALWQRRWTCAWSNASPAPTTTLCYLGSRAAGL